MRLTLITLGEPTRLTGGYLYHLRVAEMAPRHGARIEFVSFPDRPFPLAILNSLDVMRRVRATRPDAVLLDSIAAAFLGPLLWLRGCEVPVLGILHQPPGGIGHGAWRTALQSWLDRLAYARASRLLVASQSLKDEMTAMGFGADFLQAVAPGCDVAETVEAPASDLRCGRKAALLCVANWVPMKDVCSLLDAFAAMPADAATLHLAGDEDVDAAYAARIRRRLRELPGRVVTHGKLTRAQVAGMYRAADVFVLPSLRETYGTVYGEAMACGLPVVGWRAGNLPHLARSGSEGLIVEPGDVRGLSESLLRLATDEPLRRRMAGAAQARARALPTWADTTRAILDAVREVLGQAAYARR
jgi:glycosyltransferase involved in cell wall biosynthesis